MAGAIDTGNDIPEPAPVTIADRPLTENAISTTTQCVGGWV